MVSHISKKSRSQSASTGCAASSPFTSDSAILLPSFEHFDTIMHTLSVAIAALLGTSSVIGSELSTQQSTLNATNRALQLSGPAVGLTNCFVAENIDLVGGDFMSVRSAKNGCCSLCKLHGSTCKGWSWSNYNGGTCWLKSGDLMQNAKISIGVTSGILSKRYDALDEVEFNKKSKFFENCDIPGNDLRALTVGPSSDWVCGMLCTSTDGCKAATLSDYLGGTCWLKTASRDCVYARGVKSTVRWTKQ